MNKFRVLLITMIIMATFLLPVAVAFARYIPCDYCGGPIVFLGTTECGCVREYGCRKHVAQTQILVGEHSSDCPLGNGR
ncbi:MAG: hypothetical protein RR791_04070 [Lachnospiraceae bacterium]